MFKDNQGLRFHSGHLTTEFRTNGTTTARDQNNLIMQIKADGFSIKFNRIPPQQIVHSDSPQLVKIYILS